MLRRTFIQVASWIVGAATSGLGVWRTEPADPSDGPPYVVLVEDQHPLSFPEDPVAELMLHGGKASLGETQLFVRLAEHLGWTVWRDKQHNDCSVEIAHQSGPRLDGSTRTVMTLAEASESRHPRPIAWKGPLFEGAAEELLVEWEPKRQWQKDHWWNDSGDIG